MQSRLRRAMLNPMIGQPPPRFTLHLSTALVLLFILSAIVGLQCQPGERKYSYLLDDPVEVTYYGFPFPCYESPKTSYRTGAFDLASIILNLLVILPILASTIAICEGRIRREPLPIIALNVAHIFGAAFLGFLLLLMFVTGPFK